MRENGKGAEDDGKKRNLTILTHMIPEHKKKYRCKYIFRVKYTRVEKPKVSTPEPQRIDLGAIPTGMTFQTMDKIILSRGRRHMCRYSPFHDSAEYHEKFT